MRPILLLLGLTLAASPSFGEEHASTPGALVLDHKMQDIDGKETDLAKYKGKVVMIVNVASKCGMTPQYEQLVKIYHEHKDRGFVVLGFPANNFGSQEPGTNEEIKEFCATTYEVDFPLFSKISVKDDDIHPLYKELTSEKKILGSPVRLLGISQSSWSTARVASWRASSRRPSPTRRRSWRSSRRNSTNRLHPTKRAEKRSLHYYWPESVH